LGDYQIIAIASSTGGPKAIRKILGGLPGDLPAAIMVVQHMIRGFIADFVRSLQTQTPLEVQLAREDQFIKPGMALVAPDDFHLVLRGDGRVGLIASPPRNGHRPSADVLFQSVAQACGRKAVGVVLTGMGCDGAEGIKSIKEAGGFTIAQDEASSVVFGMPKACIETGAIDEVLPLDRIASRILELLGG